MSTDVIVALISNGTTILVGVLAAFVGYKASVKGAKIQIEHERESLLEANEEHREFTKAAIETFVNNEIKKNFKEIYSEEIGNSLRDLDTPFRKTLNSHGRFSFNEFNNVKYELIKTKSDSISKILKIYEMFTLIEREIEIHNYTQKEYDLVREAYQICLNEYWRV